MKAPFQELMSGATSRWDKFWYAVVWWLGSLQAIVLKKCVREQVWRSFNGRVNVPRTMTDDHLVNTVAYCERTGQIDNTYEALMREIDRRGLEPQLLKLQQRRSRWRSLAG